jgi:predicted N-formylglutamate amidohydrolase
LVTIHSFTRVFNGVSRDVELGILCDSDERLADEMLARAPGLTDMLTAKNDPYGPADGVTHTLKEHALGNGLLNVMIEVRNDLIATHEDQQAVAHDAVWTGQRPLQRCAGRGWHERFHAQLHPRC